MTDAALPAPPVPAICDLRNFPDMPLEVDTLRDSDLRRRSSGDEFKAAVILWAACWHQVPSGSLPDDDIELADLAGIGTGKPALRAWLKVKVMALRGWYKASDGRLYHPVMSKKAVDKWEVKQAAKRKRDQDADRLRGWRETKEKRVSTQLTHGERGEERRGEELRGEEKEKSKTAAPTPTPPGEDPFDGKPAYPSGHDLRTKTIADLELVCPGTHIGRDERQTWEALLRGYGWEPILEACRASHDPKTNRIYLSAVKAYLAANFRITEDPSHGH